METQSTNLSQNVSSWETNYKIFLEWNPEQASLWPGPQFLGICLPGGHKLSLHPWMQIYWLMTKQQYTNNIKLDLKNIFNKINNITGEMKICHLIKSKPA